MTEPKSQSDANLPSETQSPSGLPTFTGRDAQPDGAGSPISAIQPPPLPRDATHSDRVNSESVNSESGAGAGAKSPLAIPKWVRRFCGGAANRQEVTLAVASWFVGVGIVGLLLVAQVLPLQAVGLLVVLLLLGVTHALAQGWVDRHAGWAEVLYEEPSSNPWRERLEWLGWMTAVLVVIAVVWLALAPARP
ncbi:hypothetical protein [Tuwongella immobilis]|uniref:Uncharacterized protein n=1 Tax=Tuwongella immobilis TaxID=692036 RepID=A0A6C2YI67_9BACT|nr:hypothetical protein [Tuwongella immobilis]VIP01220.1 unnamed protein product [Tuwongella immobilis]VTR97866.1 unnamed protein product [Tuwongella immobilis]